MGRQDDRPPRLLPSLVRRTLVTLACVTALTAIRADAGADPQQRPRQALPTAAQQAEAAKDAGVVYGDELKKAKSAAEKVQAANAAAAEIAAHQVRIMEQVNGSL